MVEFKCPKCGVVLTVTVKGTVETDSISDVKALFPVELENLLIFEDKSTFVRVKPRQFLGTEYFSRIASIVREAGGEYVSAGKDSHFVIPKD